MQPTAITALALAVSVTACSPSEEPAQSGGGEVPADNLEQRLIGNWQGQNDTRGSMSFSFAADSTATWIVQLPTGPDTSRVSYTATAHDGRLHIDLSGFERGPLVGSVMYGLIEFAGSDTIKMDFEPGPPGDEQVRPSDMTSADVMTLVRTEPH
jgi:hypothetical protein